MFYIFNQKPIFMTFFKWFFSGGWYLYRFVEEINTNQCNFFSADIVQKKKIAEVFMLILGEMNLIFLIDEKLKKIRKIKKSGKCKNRDYTF